MPQQQPPRELPPQQGQQQQRELQQREKEHECSGLAGEQPASASSAAMARQGRVAYLEEVTLSIGAGGAIVVQSGVEEVRGQQCGGAARCWCSVWAAM